MFFCFPETKFVAFLAKKLEKLSSCDILFFKKFSNVNFPNFSNFLKKIPILISQNWKKKQTIEPLLMSCSSKFRKHEIYLQQVSGEKIVYLVKNNLPGTHNNFCLTFSTFWCLLQQILFKFSSSFCNNTRWLGEVTSISTKRKNHNPK